MQQRQLTHNETLREFPHQVRSSKERRKSTELTDIIAPLNHITTLTAGLTTRSLGSLNLTGNTIDETVTPKATKNHRLAVTDVVMKTRIPAMGA